VSVRSRWSRIIDRISLRDDDLLEVDTRRAQEHIDVAQ